MDFVDQVKIYVKAGDGGNGVRSFRREKHVPYGGPDGGDGGNGGDVILKASTRLSTLLALQFQQHYIAKPGGNGAGSNCHGRNASPVVIQVPVGTVAKDTDTDDLIADLTEDGQEAIVAHAGHGGRGNARFATSVNHVPTKCEPGTPGVERWLMLELKLLADVGLVGFPNAGKSTLISVISAARPKIADYPFTTLEPNLGVVNADGGTGKEGREIGRTFVVADLPGLIEGAHLGAGLGIRFLRHVERTRLLVHLIDTSDANADDPVHSFEIINGELAAFSRSLMQKPMIVVATKLDATTDRTRLATLEIGRAHV